MMTEQLRTMTFDQARYAVLKALDLREGVGEYLLRDYNILYEFMSQVIDKMAATVNPGYGGLANFEIPTYEEINRLVEVTRLLPSYMLRDDVVGRYDDFIAGWVTLMNAYCDIAFQKLEQENQEDQRIMDTKRHISELGEAVISIEHLVQVGLCYIDLFKATSEILDEIKVWRESRPTSLRLSEAYLEALDFYKDKKGV